MESEEGERIAGSVDREDASSDASISASIVSLRIDLMAIWT